MLKVQTRPRRKPEHKGRRGADVRGNSTATSTLQDALNTRPPGHETCETRDPVPLLYRYDTTEVSNLDNLQAPVSVIRDAQELAADVFRADQTWFLVNGATMGLHAAIMALCPHTTDCIVLARNVHQSALNEVILAGCEVGWVGVEAMDGVGGGVRMEDVEEGLRRGGRRVKGVVVVSPTYYGVISGFEGLGEVCRRWGPVLVLDEAHGGHLGMLPGCRELAALHSGAPELLVIQSTHKFLGALTQASMLHAKGVSSALRQRVSSTGASSKKIFPFIDNACFSGTAYGPPPGVAPIEGLG